MIADLTRKQIVTCRDGNKYKLAEKPELLWGVFCDKEPVFKIILMGATCAGLGQMQLYYTITGHVIGDTHNDWDIVKPKNPTTATKGNL